MRPIGRAGITLLCVSVLAPGAAAGPESGRAAPALARAEAAADAAQSGRLADAVAATAALAGVRIPPLPAHAPLPAGLAADLDVVPLPIRAPVSRLVAAIRQGGALSAAAVRGREAEIRAAGREVNNAIRLMAGARTPKVLRRLRGLEARLRPLVDSGRIFAAALLVARAIDDALPALRAYAASLTPRDQAVAGCDLAHVPGVVCIGGSGNNTHTTDYPLLIDTSSADTHLHSAGAADPGANDNSGNGLAASVTIDLNGKDVYTTPVPAPSGTRVVQGSGEVGGIGFLVDTNGDDVYTAENLTHQALGDVGSAFGQAYAIAGFGMLADLNGDDRMLLSSRGRGWRQTLGQSYAALGGGTVVVDTNGDDIVRAEAVPEREVIEAEDGSFVSAGQASTSAFGISAVGSGAIFSHSGGVDRFEIDSPTPEIPADEPLAVIAPSAGAVGMGLGAFGGAGVAHAGSGTTTWSVTASGRAPLMALVAAEGFGVGVAGGFGALLDDGGTDSYLVSARGHAVRRASVDDSCACSGVRAAARFVYDFESSGTFVHGFGEGAIGGVGLIRDASGDDAYTVLSELIAEAEAVDGRTELRAPGPGEEVEGAEAVADASIAVAMSESMAYGVIGAGYQIDESGADRYRSEVVARVDARADALHPDAPVFTEAYGAAARTQVQAAGITAGYGELRDMGGADRYEALASTTATADPPLFVTPGELNLSAQGSVDLAGALFVDVGGTDTFVTTPADPACVGERGTGTWNDCGQGAGIGHNA